MTLVVTHNSTVTPDQIDHLGHMNVQYYALNARAATRAYLGSGRIVDMYTRHHREQLLGTELEVRSGIFDTDATSTRVYHELVNSSTGDVAATFVFRVQVQPPADNAGTIELPEHGRPRSIDIDAVPSTPTLAELRDLDLGMRAARTIDRDDTGDGDTVHPNMLPMLFWGGEPVDGKDTSLVHVGPNEEQIGWATMETRAVIDRLPSLGDRIQSFSATTSIADKTIQSSMWVYDLASDDLLCSFEVVSVMFDIDKRRAVSIPDSLRAEEAARLHPELGSFRRDG